MIDDPIKYVRDRSTEDADCWLWRQGCTSRKTPAAPSPCAGSWPPRCAKIAATKRATNGKLTPEQAHEIRTGTDRLRDVAERMGIAYATAHRIRTGQAWRDYGSPFAGLMR